MSAAPAKPSAKDDARRRRRALLAQIHIGAKELGLDEDTYRDMLQRLTGACSAAELDDDALRRVLSEYRRLGWRPGPSRWSSRKARRWRPASPHPHCRKVWAMWGELKRRGIWRDPSAASLASFVRSMTGVDDPDWLTPERANKVIEALKEMGERAGIDWRRYNRR